MPIQPSGAKGIKGTIEIRQEFIAGLRDVEEFSHLILIYAFHRCQGYSLEVTPFLDPRSHGVFATRAPKRPNAIGLSIVQLTGIKGTILAIEDVDILDGTPLLDIKPYVPRFDAVENAASVRTGWMTPYVNGGKEPDVVRTSSEADWLRERRSPGIVRRRILSNCGE